MDLTDNLVLVVEKHGTGVYLTTTDEAEAKAFLKNHNMKNYFVLLKSIGAYGSHCREIGESQSDEDADY